LFTETVCLICETEGGFANKIRFDVGFTGESKSFREQRFLKNYKKLKQIRRIVNEDENNFLDDSSNVIESYVPS